MSQALVVPSAGPAAARFPALRVPAYRWYWLTSTTAMMADNIEHVIGYWLLWELTHSPFWLGYAVIAHWAPFLVFSPFAGAWADRFDNRKLLQLSQGLYVLCSGGLGLLYLTGHLQLWHMVILLLVHGFSGVVQLPSSQVLIHDLVRKEELASALSLSAGSRNVAQFLGPVVGGGLLWAFGPGGGLLANVLIYAPFTLTLLWLRPRRSTAPARRATGLQGIIEGLGYVLQHRVMLGAILIVSIPMGVLGGFQAMMPAFAAELDPDPRAYTWLLAANGAGAIAGALILGSLGRVRGKGRILCAATLLWAGLLLAFAVTPWFWLAFVLMLCVGAWTIVANAMSQTLVQHLAPDDKRGRVMGTYGMLVHGPRVCSGVLLGAAGAALGAHLGLAVLAALVLGAVAALVLALPALRALE